MKRIKNLPLVIALVLIAIAAFGFFSIIQSLSNNVSVLVAKEDLSAYTFVSKNDFDIKQVPEAAVGEDVLTESDYEALFFKDGSDDGTVLVYPFLAGQWILENGVSKNSKDTFAVVLPDERPAAVTTTVTGAGLGTISPGDVVTATVNTGDFGGGVSVDFAKVLCLTTNSNGCANILPSSEGRVNLPSTQADSVSYYVILAVPAAEATSLTGNEVAMTLNPFCRVGAKGFFIGEECEPPSGREASRDLERKQNEEV